MGVAAAQHAGRGRAVRAGRPAWLAAYSWPMPMPAATRTARTANATTAISAVTVAVSMMFMMVPPWLVLVA